MRVPSRGRIASYPQPARCDSLTSLCLNLAFITLTALLVRRRMKDVYGPA